MAVATACLLAAPVVALDGQPAGGRYVGPGHFGLLDLGGGVQKFSCHDEADMDRGGVSVLDIRPLLWRDGWRIAGENVKPGTDEIESARTGTALELGVEGLPRP
jgi:arabinan endo-1,5-alpha-L-arabinosidase